MIYVWLSVLIALVGILLATFITITLYFIVMARFEKARAKSLNLWFIIFIFFIVLIIHTACIATKYKDSTEGDIGQLIVYGLQEIFREFGGLTFEGQEFAGELAPSLWYFGSIAWLAISDLCLIVIGLSYPKYSRAYLIAKKFIMFFCGIDVYIFTYATKDSLLMADSIVKEYEELRKNKSYKAHRKNKKCLIIFSSYEIAPFDKDNEVHFKISQSNYLFVPIPKIDYENRKSILVSLFGCRAKKAHILKFVKKHNISIFALAENAQKIGDESKNSDIVFDDINLVLSSIHDAKVSFNKLLEINKKDCRYINYYILSNLNINFEFYENSLIRSYEQSFAVKGLALRNLPPFCNITVLNEALMAAEDLTYKRHQKWKEPTLDEAFLFDNSDENINLQEDGHRSLVIGFGLNGQMALCHLFCDCIGGKLEDDMFVPNAFSAEVLDAKIDEIISPFIASHPSFVFFEGPYKNVTPDDPAYTNLKNRYLAFRSDIDFAELNKYMAFPKIFYRKENYNDAKFLNTVKQIDHREYDSIVISLGDDERNITCANVILQSLRQSATRIKEQEATNLKKMQIFVNIRDYHNNGRLLWNETIDPKLMKGVYVYIFGNAKDIYSYKTLDYTNTARIHRTYEEIVGTGYQDNERARWEFDYLMNCGLFERKTNAAAYEFGIVYSRYIDKVGARELIDADYQKYTQEKKDNSSEQLNAKGKKIRCFDRKVDPNIIANITTIRTGFNQEKTKLKATLANHVRIEAAETKDYLKKGTIGYYWRYLTQFDHNRWCRHIMMYGRTFTHSFEPFVYDKSETDYEQKSSKYWKNNFELHDCLLPYSTFTNFEQEPHANYLNYHEEDYDYGVIIAALDMNKVKEAKPKKE